MSQQQSKQRVRFYYDFEFIDDGRTIDPLSLGMVCEDGTELYLVNVEADVSRANDWVRENVLPFLSNGKAQFVTRPQMMSNVLAFVSGRCVHMGEAGEPVTFLEPEFWGYYSAYDHVALAQLFGPMVELPKGWPFYTRDVEQHAEDWGYEEDFYALAPAEGQAHSALDDARWVKRVHEALVSWRERRITIGQTRAVIFGVEVAA